MSRLGRTLDLFADHAGNVYFGLLALTGVAAVVIGLVVDWPIGLAIGALFGIGLAAAVNGMR